MRWVVMMLISPLSRITVTEQYEVLFTDDMIDCVKEINTVDQILSTTIRILLNYFNWDKEKLMEKFFDGSQDELFLKGHVNNPFKEVTVVKPKLSL